MPEIVAAKNIFPAGTTKSKMGNLIFLFRKNNKNKTLTISPAEEEIAKPQTGSLKIVMTKRLPIIFITKEKIPILTGVTESRRA